MAYKPFDAATPRDRQIIAASNDGDDWDYVVTWWEPRVEGFITDMDEDGFFTMLDLGYWTHWSEIPRPTPKAIDTMHTKLADIDLDVMQKTDGTFLVLREVRYKSELAAALEDVEDHVHMAMGEAMETIVAGAEALLKPLAK